MLSGRHSNGIYQIRNETNDTLNVYCDFDSEPGAAWTLVQSYSLEKGKTAQGRDIFSTKPLYEDFPVNELSPGEWSSYRLSLANMKLIRAHSTHWRATCEFPTIGIDFRDYFRALLDDYDAMIPSPPAFPLSCKLYEFINIRGNQCINCTAATTVSKSTAPFLTTNDPVFNVSCNLNTAPNDGVERETNFGWYGRVNLGFRCSASKHSTTQYWFGKM